MDYSSLARYHLFTSSSVTQPPSLTTIIDSMSFPTLISALIILSYCTMFYKVIANQEFIAVNCSYNNFSQNRVNHSTLIESIKDLTNKVASSDTNIHKLQISSFEGEVKYYGVNVINFTTNSVNKVTTVYEMVQCTANLSVQDCNSCLMSMIKELSEGCNGRLGGRVVNSNCFIRFETYPFYNISAMESSVLPFFTTLPLPSKNTTRNRLGKISLNTIIAITVPTSILLGLATFGIGLCFLKAKQKSCSKFPTSGDDHFDTVESLRYSLDTLKAATQDFSEDNKIGQGGFGRVYKGIQQNGHQIAVKKLFKSTSQVDEEFKNEVKVLAKLQHRNLVKLVGFCLAEDERLLVFEYVPNPSLDKVLFDTGEQFRLDWLTRFKIIVGIARGLLYLHEESRFKIVHRDLKPGNILLDNQMIPKIADFGMARFYGIKKEYVEANNARGIWTNSGIDQSHQSTHAGGGTFGYMAPEIARRGHFSDKTDVYSYGVMILEIISGQRNIRFHLSGLADDLLSYSWMQWKAGTPFELIDERLRSEDTISSEEMKNQVLMCIHIGLLCIQKDPKERPTMRTIVHIYSNLEEEFKKWVNNCEPNVVE